LNLYPIMPLVKMFLSSAATLKQSTAALARLHPLWATAFNVQPDVLQLVLTPTKGTVLYPDITLIDVRAKKNPERTPEFLDGVAGKMLETLNDEGIVDARVRIELFDPAGGYASKAAQ